jgi:hypothetical protein
MVEISRRTLVTSAIAGFAIALPSRASPTRTHLGYERLSRVIDDEVDGLGREPLRVIGRIQDHLRRAAEAGLFDPWRGGQINDDKVSLIGGNGGPGRWKVQLFRIAAGRSHPPHCHENLASCLVVLDGRLHVREYERLRRQETQDATSLRRVFDDELLPGQAILTAENHRNAHWFGAGGGPVLAVNFKASGYFRRELVRLRNRRYLDPSRETEGPFRAPFIPSAEAKARFGHRPV